MPKAQLTVEGVACGRNGKTKVVVRMGDDLLAVETLDLGKPKVRTAFIDAICEDVGNIDRQALESKLLEIAAGPSTKQEGANDVQDLPELDAAAIVRPERFITPQVSGLALPSMTALDNKVQGRWLLYLRWANGLRERRPLARTVDLPDGHRLFLHPEPCEPATNDIPAWSSVARRGWLGSKMAPNAAEVFKRLCEIIAYFLDLPTRQASGITATLAVWVILSYIYMAWDAVPYLFVGGPLGSGKSRLFEILGRLVWRPLMSSNLTGPALFRTLHGQGGVLLLDEAERLKNTQDPATAEIVSMLLAGYKRGGRATRLEPLGDSSFKTLHFDVFGPKALACIAGLPPALSSRAIPVTMFRSPPGSERPRRRIDADPVRWQRLRDDLHILALEHGLTWLNLPSKNDVCPKMSGRDYELWQPLLALAWWIESQGARGLLGLLQEHALVTIDASRDDSIPNTDETLLRILAEAVRLGERPTPHDILDKAMEAEPAVFKNWHPRTVTARLKSYGIPTPRKVGSRREFRDVTADMLRRIQESYGIDLDCTSDESDTPTDPDKMSQ